VALLILFAVFAGAGTALSPCVLPILPALLSAGATGGRRRPLGIVLGLATTFTITIVGIAELVDGVGLGTGVLRTAAVLVLLGFGALLLAPRLADRVEAWLSPLMRFGPRTRGDGFVSGLGVGAALGFVYAPCAGPILAAVISVSAASGTVVAVAVGYAVGSAAALLVLCLGGRRILRRVRGPALQRVMGAVMVLTALAILVEADLRFQGAIADDLPAVLVNPTGGLERSGAVEDQLADLRGRPRFTPVSSGLPEFGAAPEFAGVTRWLNSAPLTLASLRGKVVLIDFWTYTCINCLRTLPYLRAWDERYRDRGLTIVGVHTPEFEFEKDTGNVRDAIARSRLRYPVAQDNDYGTWNAWSNQYWPAKYLVDAKGEVRYVHFGEGAYAVTEEAIRDLLEEAGVRAPGVRIDKQLGEVPGDATPETYLGAARAQGWLTPPRSGVHEYPGARTLPPDRFALKGRWRVDDESAEAVARATLTARVHGKSIYLVLGSHEPGRVEVVVDGRHERTVTVDGQRLYELMRRPGPGEHELTLKFEPGVAGYAFTFG
jgi:cytochrome c biogenesis protein CcdA/thiol-disulfide isomerase/thioredoxin